MQARIEISVLGTPPTGPGRRTLEGAVRELRGRAAAVTGAGSGIGRALAVRLAREGVRLALADIDADALAETERALGPDGGAAVVTLRVNLLGIPHRIRAVVPRMIEQGGEGHIVNTCSVAGLFAGPGAAPYTVSKWAAF